MYFYKPLERPKYCRVNPPKEVKIRGSVQKGLLIICEIVYHFRNFINWLEVVWGDAFEIAEPAKYSKFIKVMWLVYLTCKLAHSEVKSYEHFFMRTPWTWRK